MSVRRIPKLAVPPPDFISELREQIRAVLHAYGEEPSHQDVDYILKEALGEGLPWTVKEIVTRQLAANFPLRGGEDDYEEEEA